jgi:hypothetical protein
LALYGDSNQWIINATSSLGVEESNGWWKTSYSGGTLWLHEEQSLWGDGFSNYGVPLSSVVIFSKYGLNSLEFNFQAIALVDGYTFKLSGSYDSELSEYPYNQQFIDNTELTSHDGYRFSWVKMEVSQVPIPAAACGITARIQIEPNSFHATSVK